ncbi:hypothetical protein BJ138DRAFT_1111246 [Hygrophoropsis aurantiaca]|uniref:Uncharacterized protein n=1 Tax=Hygrophoropsis aurantiaca TaxID=72124 RepID=A0ACB8AKH5_9AGAM|nr:hypothetical protein BJ138DRAFT_1111246 [Hygrophoropsis aurantiaca]
MSANATATSQPAAGLVSLELTFGAAFVGLLISTGLYGVLCVQTYNYSQRFSDRWPLKSLIAVLWVVDTFHIICVGNAVYNYLVVQYFNPVALETTQWTINVHVILTCFVESLVQMFFAYRVYILSNRNKLITGAIVLLSCIQFGFGFSMTVKAFTLKYFATLTTVEWIVGTSLSCNLACDVLTAVSMVYFLHASKTGFKRTESILNTLIIYALSTGTLTSIVATLNIAVFLAMPTNFVNIGVNITMSKLYSNALLATVNARNSGHRFKSPDELIYLSDLPSGSGITSGEATLNASREASSSGKNGGESSSLYGGIESYGKGAHV